MTEVFHALREQPPLVEISLAPGLFVKQMLIAKAGSWIPQHSHAHGHLSMLAVGAVHVWKDGHSLGRFDAPCGILIEAGCKHTFAALVDNTIIYCIHRVDADGNPEILEEHQLVAGP